jgi:uncharacterized protein
MHRSLALAISLSFVTAAAAQCVPSSSDVVVVGAGISGLSAALEGARAGVNVVVIEMSSVFGGHAVMTGGGLLFAGSPLQRQKGIEDTPAQAYRDMVAWGEDINHAWAKYYTSNGMTEVHDWLQAMGVQFVGLGHTGGNSVPRFHVTTGGGLRLVSVLYLNCLERPNIRFVWNTRVTGLKAERGRYFAETTNVRTGQSSSISAAALVLATGGSQSNSALLQRYWPKDVPFPQRLLLGSGINSMGEGLKLAAGVGAKIDHMDYQWHYPSGLPDPRDPTQTRGLWGFNHAAIWVNRAGNRFINELAAPKFATPAMIQQPESSYWMIFDEVGKKYFTVAGTDWSDPNIVERMILGNPELVKKAPSLTALAEALGLPADAVTATVERYNRAVEQDNDEELHRFGPLTAEKWGMKAVAPRSPVLPLRTPPFYGARSFPLSRKNNGGVQVNLSCNVIHESGGPIQGLYAVGELTGSGGGSKVYGWDRVWR